MRSSSHTTAIGPGISVGTTPRWVARWAARRSGSRSRATSSPPWSAPGRRTRAGRPCSSSSSPAKRSLSPTGARCRVGAHGGAFPPGAGWDGILPPEGGRPMSTSSNLAVVVDPDAPGRLVIRSVPEPTPDRGEAIVRVRAISLNRGEVRRAGMAAAGWRPGWDLAGVVERAAADGSGPSVGARVVGFLPEGAWAQRVAVPKSALAELPDKVTLSQAATFPVAGLTALHALAKGGPLLGRRVLITGATGGVGDFAVQLARLAGAHVTANARRADQGSALKQLGAHEGGVGEEIARSPKYDLIIDSVGGRTLGTALAAPDRAGLAGPSAAPPSPGA